MSYKTPKDVQERKDANHKRILDTAAKIIAERGYNNTTVKDIVDEAGMSVGSFYFYFKNKEDLLEKLFEQAVSLIIEVMERDVSPGSFGIIERTCDVVTLTLAFFQERRELAKVMMIEAIGINPDFERKNAKGFKVLLDVIENSIREFDEKGELSAVDIELAAMAKLGEVQFVITNWLYENTSVNLVDYAYPLATYQLRAMAVEYEEEAVKTYIEELLTRGCCFKSES